MGYIVMSAPLRKEAPEWFAPLAYGKDGEIAPDQLLRHAEEMRSALRVIHTWAGVPGALDARHVLDLTAKALHMGANA